MSGILQAFLTTGRNYTAAVALLGSDIGTASGNKQVIATPATDDLIVCFGYFPSIVNNGITDNQGGTYTKLGGVGAGGLYIRDSLVASAVSHTLTMVPNTASTGGILVVLTVKRMTKVGILAVYSDGIDTTTGDSVTLDAAANVNYPVIAFGVNGLNPPAATPRAGYNELIDSGYDTPTIGVTGMSINGGEASNVIQWISLAGADCFGVCLDVT